MQIQGYCSSAYAVIVWTTHRAAQTTPPQHTTAAYTGDGFVRTHGMRKPVHFKSSRVTAGCSPQFPLSIHVWKMISQAHADCHAPAPTVSFHTPSEEAQILLARLMSGYGRDASLNAKERLAPGTMSINQLPGSPSKSRHSCCGSDPFDGGWPCSTCCEPAPVAASDSYSCG